MRVSGVGGVGGVQETLSSYQCSRHRTPHSLVICHLIHMGLAQKCIPEAYQVWEVWEVWASDKRCLTLTNTPCAGLPATVKRAST